MSYKSENWKEKLEQVRNHIALKEGSVEKTADENLSSEKSVRFARVPARVSANGSRQQFPLRFPLGPPVRTV